MDIVIGDLAPQGTSQCRVLLVDDDDFMHEMMALVLGETGFSLVSASNVDDAMRIIVRDAPDIVITDAIMPGESGFSLIEKMKSCPSSSRIPVILWTMLEQPDGSVMDSSGKADIVINKPFYRSNIVENLEKAKQMITRPPLAQNVMVVIE